MSYFLPLTKCWAFCLITVFFVGCTNNSNLQQEEIRPNIIVIHVDDLGWTDLACFGSQYYETPHIDKLAAEGMKFTNAYAAAAVCSPSRAALMTGHFPARLGITDWIRASFNKNSWKPGEILPNFIGVPDRKLITPVNQPYLPHDEQTLAELLKEAGYATCHVGKWHLGLEDWYPEKQGFDENYGGCDFGQPPSYFDPYQNNKVAGIPSLPAKKEGQYLSDREAEEVVGFIQRHQAQPFFIYLAHYAVHTPIQAKQDVAQKYAAKTVTTKQKKPEYAAMVQSVDDALGSIMETLEQLGLDQNTLLVFTSDNGGLLRSTDNTPLREGKGSPYEGGIRVPLIVKWKGKIKEGVVTDFPVASYDHFPTIADLLQINDKVTHTLDGKSYLKVLQGNSSSNDRELFWHFPHYRNQQTGPYSIIRSGEFKLIRYYDTPKMELYNLASDLSETTDLADEMPEKAAELAQRLSFYLEASNAKLPRPNPDYVNKTPN